MAIPTNHIDKITDHDSGESRPICPPAEHVSVDNENFEGNTLDEVLDEVAQAIEEASQGGYAPPQGGIPKTDLAQDVQDSLDNADSAVQPTDLATVAKTGSYNDLKNKPVIPTTTSALVNDAGYITENDLPEGVTVDDELDAESDKAVSNAAVCVGLAGKVDKENGKSLMTDAERSKLAGLPTGADLTTAMGNKQDKISAGNGIVIGNDGKTVSVAESIRTGAGKGATAVQSVSVDSEEDGTVDIHVDDDTYTINLNHEHPQYQPLLTAGSNITITTDPQTGEVTISAAGGGGGGGISGITMNGTAVTVNNGVANLGTVLTQHQSLAGRVQSQDVVNIVKITQSAYDALSTKDSTTLYLITGS